jgi:cytidylate kinase
MPANPVVTLSRSLGSGGTEVGFMVARRLGWAFCDRRILRLAAEAMGHPASGLAHLEERQCGFLEQMMNIIGFGSPEACYTPLLTLPIYSSELFNLERQVMLKLAARAPSVLVGRGGFCALRQRPATLHVSIRADLDFRIQHLVARGKAADPATARKAIAVSDRDRAAFIRAISGLDWQDPGNFDLVLDASGIGLEVCVERLLEEVGSRLGPGCTKACGAPDSI